MSVRSRESTWASPVVNCLRRLERWWLDRPVRMKGLLVISVPLIALICTTSASLVLQFKEHQERSIAVASSNLTKAAGLVLADAVNAESGIRGYAATRDPVFLNPYYLAVSRLGAERSSLRTAAITEGDSRAQQEVDVTTGQVLSQLAQMHSEVSGGISANGLLEELLQTKTTMDLLRDQMAAMTAGPAAMVIPRRDQITGLETTIDIVDIAGLVLGLLAGLVGVALFTSGISRRLAVAAANADRLGEAQALEPADRSDDELGRLADSLVRAEELLAGRAARAVPAAARAAGGDRGLVGRRHREQERGRPDYELEPGRRAHLRLPGSRDYRPAHFAPP